jgi:uncharacterized protein YdaU (DUF1376 family)
MKYIIKSSNDEKEKIKKEIKLFRDYYEKEMKDIGDKRLKKEINKFDHIKYAKFESVNEDSLGKNLLFLINNIKFIYFKQ